MFIQMEVLSESWNDAANYAVSTMEHGFLLK